MPGANGQKSFNVNIISPSFNYVSILHDAPFTSTSLRVSLRSPRTCGTGLQLARAKPLDPLEGAGAPSVEPVKCYSPPYNVPHYTFPCHHYCFPRYYSPSNFPIIILPIINFPINFLPFINFPAHYYSSCYNFQLLFT